MKKIIQNLLIRPFTLILLISATACATNTQKQAVGSSLAENYELRSTDKIEIQVYGQEDLSSIQRINGEGVIKVSLLGEINVEGLTAREAEAKIEDLFVSERLLRDPEVNINVVEYSERAITVLGSVNQPGQIVLNPEINNISISNAIASAGGFTRLANPKVVKVVRSDGQGERRTWEVDVRDILNGDSSTSQFTVIPGDTIYVKERLF